MKKNLEVPLADAQNYQGLIPATVTLLWWPRLVASSSALCSFHTGFSTSLLLLCASLRPVQEFIVPNFY